MNLCYEFQNPTKIISSRQALESLPHQLRLMGVKKPLVVTDKGVKRAGIIDIVSESFAESEWDLLKVVDDVPQDSSLETVKMVAQSYKKKLVIA